MKNMKCEIQGKNLVITVDLTQKLGKSKSGKTDLVATSEGNISVAGAPEGFKLGLNAYVG